MIDLKRERSPRLHGALLDGADMRIDVAGIFLRVGHSEANAVRDHDTGIADLPAGFAVERRLIEDDDADLALFQRADFLAIAQNGSDHAFGTFGFVA